MLAYQGDIITIDESQLAIALKSAECLKIEIKDKLLTTEDHSQKKQNHWESQKRNFGRFVRQKKTFVKRHPGLGRKCPKCNKPLRDTTSLKRHLLSKTACPGGIVLLKEIPSLIIESQRLAKLDKYSSNHNNDDLKKPKDGIAAPSVNVTVNNGVPYLPSEPSQTCAGRDLKLTDIFQCIDDFERSLDNPVFGPTHQATSTKKKIQDDVRRVITISGIKSLEQLFSDEGLAMLKKPFARDVQYGTKKANCQALLKFVEFADLNGDAKVDEKHKARLIYYLEKACDSFKRGVSIDNAFRRVKLSEGIRKNELPTYGEVCKVHDHLEVEVCFVLNLFLKLSDLRNIGSESFLT